MKYKKIIPLKTKGKISFVRLNDILFIKGAGNYIEVNTEKRRYLCRDSLNNFMDSIDSISFIRIHKSVIVSKDYIDELVYSGFGEIDVVMVNGDWFTIGRAYKEKFMEECGIK